MEQECFNNPLVILDFPFANCLNILQIKNQRVHKLSRMMTRMKRPHLTYQVPPQSYCHVTIIQYVVYISSTSSWSFLQKTDRFQMIMTTLKMCSLFKEKYPDRGSSSVSGIIYFLVCIKSVPSCQARHRFITTWEKQVRLLV